MAPRDTQATDRLKLPTWRALRVPMALILVFVVVVVAVWAAAANYLLVDRSPEAPVDTYLGYLEGGSARQVLAPLLIGQDRGLAQLIPNDAYRAAAGRPQGHEFVGTRGAGSSAVVGVDVHLGDGSTVRRDYRVRRTEAPGPFNDSWQLRRPDHAPVSVRLPAAVDALSLNGVTVRPDTGSLTPTDGAAPARTWRFEGLPGEYDVALPPDSYLLASQHAKASISLAAPRPAAADLRFGPSPRMWEEVDREVRSSVARCQRVVRFDAEHCPVPRELEQASSASEKAPEEKAARGSRGGSRDGVSGIRWELKSRPALLLEQDGHDPLTFHAVRFRPAVATVTWLDGGERRSGTVAFGIDVTARTTGQQLETDVQLRSTLTQREKARAHS